MANNNSSANGTNKLTVAEMREKYEQYEKHIERFKDAEDAVKRYRDISKNSSYNISTFDKEKLRGYLRNISNSEKELRNLSWYLYYRSHVYMRIVNFFANMFALDCRSIIPNYDLTKGGDANKILKSYQDTIDFVDSLRLQQEFYNIYLTCFIQDVYYGVIFHDDTGTFILPIPADYCKIAGKYMTGDFAYYIDCSYFKSHLELLEWYPEPLKKMYDEYEKTKQKYQLVPQEYSICLKFRSEEYQTVIPPFAALFNPLINLSDLEDIQAIAAEQEIYKMLWIELETINGSKNPDDWKVDPALVVEYYNKMLNNIPEYISAAIVPGKLNEISFPNDTANDTTKVAKATETVLNTAGGAEVLNGSTINNTYAFKLACIQNTEFAISSLLPQTQSFVNRYLAQNLSNPCKIKFFEISVYTKADLKEDLLASAQNGLPNALAYNTLNGFSEKETLALNFLEQDVLKLSEKLVPLSTSYTMSGTKGKVGQGRPTVPDDELSDSGDRSRNQ